VKDKDGGYGIKHSDLIRKINACGEKGYSLGYKSDTLETPSVSGVDMMNLRV